MTAAPLETGFDGLLNLNKPVGITSASALYRVRRLTGLRRSGHAGTLDPGAGGVLLICFGKATRRVEALMALPKVYEAAGRLDVTSLSLDSDSPHIPVPVQRPPSRDEITAAAERLVGEIDQVPPQISALKVAGQPAYRRARAGRPVPLAARRVRVYSLAIVRYEWPEVEFRVHCGRGTYVRALIRDLGQTVGTGGCLTALSRTAVGPFRIEEAASFGDLQAGAFDDRRVPLAELDRILEENRGPAPQARA